MTISIRRAVFALALCGSVPLVAPLYLAPAHAQVAPATVELSAVVHAPDGTLVEGAEILVIARGKDEAPFYIELKTDAQGRFVTRQPLTKSVSEVFVHAPGYALQRASLAPAKAGEITLKSGITATGKVVAANGQPVADAKIEVEYLVLSGGDEPDERSRYLSLNSLPENFGLKRVLQTQTDENGNWQLDGLPAESQVVFQLLDSRFARAQVDLTVSADSQKAPDLVAKPGATLKGRVLTPDGKPLADAPVAVNVGAERGSYAATHTAADGTYSLASLPPGAAKIEVSSPVATLAPQGIQGVLVKAGETVEAPEIQLDAGVLLTGKVLDKESKAPLAGARIMAQGDFGGVSSEATGADGVYKVRVPPGPMRFYVYSTPEDYLRAMFNDAKVTVGAVSTQAPDFALQRGLSLSGTALDETGAPAQGAVISAGSAWDGAQTTVDAQGAWKLSGVDPQPNGRTLPPDKIELQSAGAWQIVGDGLVSSRAGDKIAVTLQRIELQDVTLRVVTPAGEPIAGAQARVAVTFDARNGSMRFENLIANARGEVTVKRLRPDESAEITPSKDGYALQKAGAITTLAAAKNGRATDAVLAPKNGAVAGIIVDSAGAPVAGARVAVLGIAATNDAATWATSDAQGRFNLANLSAGQLVVGAARGRDWGQVEAQTGAAQVTIKLAPAAPQPPPQDRELAINLLKEWLAGEPESYTLINLAAHMAAAYPDEGAQLAAVAGNRAWFEGELAQVLAKSDPTRALELARAQVATPKKPDEHERDTRELAELLIQSGDLKAAQEIYDGLAPAAIDATKNVAPDGAVTAGYRYAQLAGISGALGDTDATFWVEMLDRTVAQMSDDERMFRIGGYAAAFARSDRAGALDWLETRPPAERIRAYEDVIPLVASRDLPRAQELLAAMDALIKTANLPVEEARNDAMYRPTPQRSQNVARAAIVNALLATDAQTAYQESTKLTDDGYGLDELQIKSALRLPPARALPILRAQFARAQAKSYDQIADMARLALLVAPLDAALSEQWFDAAREKLTQGRQMDEETRQTADGYAFYRAAGDAGQSRLLLENEWHRALPSAMDKDVKISRLQALCWAMVPVNWERAREMVREKDASLGAGQYNGVLTQRNFILWLLASERERHEMYVQGASLDALD